MDPLISVIIVTHNGYAYIKECLASVKQNPYTHLQIIVVDNASTDLTPQKLHEEFANIEIIELPQNIGPAAARNHAIEHIKGEYVLFLDNDTTVEKNTIYEALNVFYTSIHIGIVQCKLVFMHDHDRLDCTGEYISNLGFLVHRTEVGAQDDRKENPEVIFAAKSAGMFIQKKVLDEVGSFDPDYFIYLEETDLAWRAWHRGYTAAYAPKSIVYHASGTSSKILTAEIHDYNAKFHGCKNYVLSLIKNLSFKNLITILPVHIVLWIGLAYYSLLKGYVKPWIWIHQALFWNIRHLNQTLIKRTIVQKRRKLSDEAIFKHALKHKNLRYYITKVTTPIKVGNAEGFFKKSI